MHTQDSGPKTSLEYEYYLLSPEWKERRTACLERDGNRCTKCEATTYLQAHHLTYARVFNEHPDDLVTLCDRCHARAHGRRSRREIRDEHLAALDAMGRAA